MENNDLELKVRKLTQDIVGSFVEQASGSVFSDEIQVPATLVLVTCAFASRKITTELLEKEYGEDLQYLVFDDDLIFRDRRVVRTSSLNPQILLNKLSLADRIVLLAPRISTLTNLAKGNDAGLLEQLVLKALLWGIEVSVWLDFKPMKFKRNTFYARVLDAIDALVDMGVGFRTYNCLPEGRTQPLPTLLTEKDILDAKERGDSRILCADGAVITPSALDAAELYQIRIEKR